MTPSNPFIVLASLLTLVSPPAEPLPGTAPRLRPAWELDLGDARGAALRGCARVGDRVLVTDQAGGVTALDPRTGAMQWFVQAPGPLRFRPSDGGAIALASGSTVIAVDGATGRRLLDVTSASVPGVSPCSDGQRLYVPACLDDTLVAWDLRSGHKSWEFRMPAPFVGVSLVCGAEGSRSVLVCTADDWLRAIPAQADVPPGERWSLRIGRVAGAPALGGGRVYVSTFDRTIVALDEASGTVLWKQFPGQVPRVAPVLVGEHLAVQTTSGLLLLSAATGVIEWELEGGGAPIGEVGGELLLQHTEGPAEWREIATGRLLADDLPHAAAACGSRLIELKSSASVAAWERAER